MSCHDIGRGLNSVSIVVDDLLEKGEISRAVAKKLFRACRKGVNWCDGNAYEATRCLDGRRCGCCLCSDRPLTSINDIPWLEKKYQDVIDFLDPVSDTLCPECVKAIRTTV